MHIYIWRQEAVADCEFARPAAGLDAGVQLAEFLQELFLGLPGESAAVRTVRLDAARGILADLQADAPELAAYVAVLLGATPMIRCADVRRSTRIEAAG